MSDRLTFAEAVKRVRTSRNLTQQQLAAKAHLSRTQLVRLEAGLKPGPLARQRLVGALGFSNVLGLLAAAGDREAIERIAGHSVNDRAKRPAATPIAAAGARKRATGGNAIRWRVMG